MKKFAFILLMLLSPLHLNAKTINQNPESISCDNLQNYNSYPEKVKKLVELTRLLTTKNLGYQYGSANPDAGGMDCSGTIYYILNALGVKDVPRSADLIYLWVKEKGHFYPVNSNQLDSVEFSHLNPGDLLFWSGTYEIARTSNVTHVMLYIGKNKDGQPLMMGSSDGRTYKGRKIYGVSVFDFQLPAADSKSHFLGYSCIPGINCNTSQQKK